MYRFGPKAYEHRASKVTLEELMCVIFMDAESIRRIERGWDPVPLNKVIRWVSALKVGPEEERELAELALVDNQSYVASRPIEAAATASSSPLRVLLTPYASGWLKGCGLGSSIVDEMAPEGHPWLKGMCHWMTIEGLDELLLMARSEASGIALRQLEEIVIVRMGTEAPL